MGGRFHQESVAVLFRNEWQVWAGIYTYIRKVVLNGNVLAVGAGFYPD